MIWTRRLQPGLLGARLFVKKRKWEVYRDESGLGPHDLYSKTSKLTLGQRQALWNGVQAHGTSWREIRQSTSLFGEFNERSLQYHAKILGILLPVEMNSTNPFEPAPTTPMFHGEYVPWNNSEEEGTLETPLEFFSSTSVHGQHASERSSERSPRQEGTGFLRREQQDRSAADNEPALLTAAFAAAAPSRSMRCSEKDCLCILTPADISCWCRDCKVHRCHDCSDLHRSSPASYYVHATWLCVHNVHVPVILHMYHSRACGASRSGQGGLQSSPKVCPGVGEGVCLIADPWRH